MPNSLVAQQQQQQQQENSHQQSHPQHHPQHHQQQQQPTQQPQTQQPEKSSQQHQHPKDEERHPSPSYVTRTAGSSNNNTNTNNEEDTNSQTTTASKSIPNTNNSTISSSNTNNNNNKRQSSSSNDVYKRCVQRRLQRYDTYGDDDDDDDDDGECDANSTNSNTKDKQQQQHPNNDLLETWEQQSDAMDEVAGSQSVLTQELELKRYSSIGSMIGGVGNKELIVATGLTIGDTAGGGREMEVEVGGIKHHTTRPEEELGLTRLNSIDGMDLTRFNSIGSMDLSRFHSIGTTSMELNRYTSIGSMGSIGTTRFGKPKETTTLSVGMSTSSSAKTPVASNRVDTKDDVDTGDEHGCVDFSQDTLVHEPIAMRGDADESTDDDSGDCTTTNNKKLLTNDILNNRILASQPEEEDDEDDADQEYTQTQTSLLSSSEHHQQQNSLSLSQLSQISLPMTPSQASITMSGYDMIIGAAQELAKRDGEDVPFPNQDVAMGGEVAGGEGSQECDDLGGCGPLNTDNSGDDNDGDDDDWATLPSPPLLKKEENSTVISTNVGSGNGEEVESIMIRKVSNEENDIPRNEEENNNNNNNQDETKGDPTALQESNNKGMIKKVTDEEIATIWNREDGSIIRPPKINPPSSIIQQQQNVDVLRGGATSLARNVCGPIHSSVVLANYPQAVQQSNICRPKMIPTNTECSISVSPPPPPLPPPHVTPPPLTTTTIPPKPKPESTPPLPPLPNPTDTNEIQASSPPLPPPPPAHRLARKTKIEREAEKAETNNIAKRAAELVSQFRVDRSVEKQLLLSMALTRENPRSAPNLYPGHGTSIYNGFYWGQYPPLEKVLRSHMEEYYELSITKCQSRAQQAFNNKLVALVKGEAEQFGWIFHKPDFDEKRIRDRIRCFFKTHIQNAKKRLKTMVRNPTKKANAKALVAHMDLINKHDRSPELEEQQSSSPICSNSGISDDGISNFIGKDDDSRPYGHSHMSGVTNCSNNTNNLETCQERSLLLENKDCTKSIMREKDHDARDAAQVLALGFGR